VPPSLVEDEEGGGLRPRMVTGCMQRGWVLVFVYWCYGLFGDVPIARIPLSSATARDTNEVL